MPRSHRRSTRSRSHRRQRGGTGNAPNPSTYGSASSYGMAVNGTGDSQFDRVFNQNGPDAGTQSNAIVGVQGQHDGIRSMWKQGGGKRRRRSSKSRKGGFFGEVINRAIVPLSILGMQQTYRRKKGGRKTRRHRRR